MKLKSAILVLAAFSLGLAPLHAVDLFWDADGVATAATGGLNNWETSTSLWRNGSVTGTLQLWPTTGGNNDAFLGGTAGTLTLTTGINANDLSVDPTSGTSYTVTGATQTLTLGGSTSPVIDVATGDSLTISSRLAGNQGFTKTSAGTLILDTPQGTGGLIGGITISGGTLQAGSATNSSSSQVLRSNWVNLGVGTSLTTVGTAFDLRVGSLSGSGSITPATGGAINELALADSVFSGTITATGGLNLRGGNGTTQTFNGNLTGLTGTIGINSGATLKLSGTAANAGMLGSLLLATRGGTITLDNSGGNAAGANGRIANTAALTFLGGKFELISSSTSTTVETVGAYTMNVGQNTIRVVNIHSGGTGAYLALASFTRTSGNAGTVNFVGAGIGTLGSAGNNPQVMFNTAPGLTNNVIANSAGSGILGFATVNGTDFAGYGANGVVAVSSTAVSGALASASTQNSVITANGATIAGSNVGYNTLKIAPTSSGFTLDLTGAGALNTAGILLAGNNDFTIRNTGGGTGGLVAGNQRFVNVANAGTTLSVGVSLVSSNNAFTKSGDGILALTGTASQIGGTSATNYGIAGGVFRGSLTSLGGGAASGGANTTIQLRGGVLEISGGGTLTRAIDLVSTASGGSITFDQGNTDRGDGGFSAIGGAATVTLVTAIGGSTAASLVWNDGAFLSNGYVLTMGSTKADNLITLSNNIGLDDGALGANYFAREIRVTDNTSSTADTARLSGVISGSSNADLLKTGNGVLELTNSNTYDGNTLVQQGTLLINGNQSAANGTVSVASGAILGGTGTVGGATTIKSGGHLAVGNSPGTQTFSSTLAFESGSIFDWELNAATSDTGASNQGSYDKVIANGAVSGTSIFTVVLGTNAFSDVFWDTNKSWTDIFTGAGAPSDLASIFTTFGGSGVATSGLVSGEGQFGFTGSTLNWTAVPEPSSALAGLLVAAGLLRRRRVA